MAKRAGFLDQILTHQVKRSRLWFPRSSAQIQPRGIKRKRPSWSWSWSWGAKRARNALGGPPWLSACSLPRRLKRGRVRVPPKALSGPGPGRCAHLLAGSRRVYSSDLVESDPIRRRDWASLGDDGPGCLIAELVLANDVADYVRFRAVCRPWRRCSVDPRCSQGGGLEDGRFHPRQWVMLDKALVAEPCCYRFLNISTGECIRTDLPELAEHTLHAVTPEGLLLLLHRSTLVLRLLNPLTRRLTDLPPATTLVTEQQLSRQGGGQRKQLGERLCVYSAGIASTTVAIYFNFPMGIAVAKPGDQRWRMVYHRYVDATLSFAGRFYCAIGTSVMVLDTSASDPPRLVTAVKRSFGLCRMSDSLHLLDNAGELMLVHRLPVRCEDTDAANGGGEERYKMDYKVYRVDLDAGALVPVMSFNGRAVFIGRIRTISVPAGTFSSISADTLYLGSDCSEKIMWNKIQAYNVADGSTQPYCHDSCMQPYGVVDCISHCIMETGSHLV